MTRYVRLVDRDFHTGIITTRTCIGLSSFTDVPSSRPRLHRVMKDRIRELGDAGTTRSLWSGLHWFPSLPCWPWSWEYTICLRAFSLHQYILSSPTWIDKSNSSINVPYTLSIPCSHSYSCFANWSYLWSWLLYVYPLHTLYMFSGISSIESIWSNSVVHIKRNPYKEVRET